MVARHRCYGGAGLFSRILALLRWCLSISNLLLVILVVFVEWCLFISNPQRICEVALRLSLPIDIVVVLTLLSLVFNLEL